MAEMVTLLRNPSKSTNTVANPRRRRRRRMRRNPDLVRTVTRPLPNFADIAVGLGGAAVAMQGPNLFGVTRWMNVLTSGLITVAGAIGLQAMRVRASTRDSFTLGGMVITLGKGLHVLTNGRAGIPTDLAFTTYNIPGLPGGGGGNGEEEGVSRNGVVAHAAGNSVGAFLERDFHGGGAEAVPTLLT